jgi:hypothetical protein
MVTSASTPAPTPLALPGNLRIPATTAPCTGSVTAKFPQLHPASLGSSHETTI